MKNANQSQFRRLWDAAGKLIAGQLILDGQSLPSPGFFDRRRLKKALKLFESAAILEPDNAAPVFFASKIQERLGDLPAQLRYLRRAVEREPGQLILVIELGAALGRSGLHQEAVQVLIKGAAQHPEDPRIHCNLGLTQLMLGNAQAAAAAFQRLVELEPHQPNNHRLHKLAADVSRGLRPVPKSEKQIVKWMLVPLDEA